VNRRFEITDDEWGSVDVVVHFPQPDGAAPAGAAVEVQPADRDSSAAAVSTGRNTHRLQDQKLKPPPLRALSRRSPSMPPAPHTWGRPGAAAGPHRLEPQWTWLAPPTS
jgi:hypothetical protein